MKLLAKISLCIIAQFSIFSTVGAQQNSYGGFDIVGLGPKAETLYGNVRDWKVMAALSGTNFAYCVAIADRGDGSRFRLGWDGQQWQLAVPVKSKPDWEGTLQVDGQGAGQGYQRGGDFISGTAKGKWTIAWLGEAELDGLRKGQSAILSVGKQDYDFPLSNAAASILKVQECVKRAGKPLSKATDIGSDSQIKTFANAGSWVINTISAGGKVVACEAYDQRKENLRFEIDKDNSYIDFSDGGEMGALGQKKKIKIAFDPGSSPENRTVLIMDGRDGKRWARITEGRMDGPGLVDDAFSSFSQVSFIGKNIMLETGLEGTGKALQQFFKCSDTISQ